MTKRPAGINTISIPPSVTTLVDDGSGNGRRRGAIDLLASCSQGQQPQKCKSAKQHVSWRFLRKRDPVGFLVAVPIRRDRRPAIGLGDVSDPNVPPLGLGAHDFGNRSEYFRVRSATEGNVLPAWRPIDVVDLHRLLTRDHLADVEHLRNFAREVKFPHAERPIAGAPGDAFAVGTDVWPAAGDLQIVNLRPVGLNRQNGVRCIPCPHGPSPRTTCRRATSMDCTGA